MYGAISLPMVKYPLILSTLAQRAQKTCIASAIDVDGKPHKAVADQLFSNIPKDELYKRLIDLFRLRAEDSFIYSGPQPFWILEYRWRDQDFEEYLEKCSAKELLPSWFDKASKAECRTLAMDSHQEWFIGHAIDEEDIEQRYGISYVKPLRSLAAHIFDHAFEYSKDPDDIGVLLAWREKEYAQGGFHRLPRKPGQERLSRYDLRPRHGHDRIERSHRLLDDYKQVQKEMSFDEYCTIMEGAGLGYGMGCICDHPDFKGRGFSRIE